ncbi:MAG TPA: DNA recombination protein RmuC [Vicinamibacterales bacterium]|jgi:DNA recombination protein RmuC|nr:DNA recombination protein RmuC [Vicinamibacterales bacterium]
MNLLIGIAAAVVGAVLAYWLAASAGRRQLAEQRAALVAELAAVTRDNEWLKIQVEREREALGTMRDAFQSLAADALQTNRTSFLESLEARQQAFDGLVQPIADVLKKVDGKLSEAERERLEAYARLTERVAALGSSADMLSRALRTPAVRGRWGEMQLRRVVEIAGMLPRCDFDEQPSLQGDNGRLRPDLIVHLPGGKQIVVDAKAPLEAFLDAQAATDEDSRLNRLLAHARQVREHMDKLGSKAYWEALPTSPEFVVMFLPGETLFSAALQNDLNLIEHGLGQRVLLASPITLIALLTTVAHSWRQAALTDNFREVAALGRELYERLATFAGHLNDVRKRLDGAVQAYNQAAGSFESRVLVTARRMKDLNVTTAEELPPAESIDTVPRVLRQMNLMALPQDATSDEIEPA